MTKEVIGGIIRNVVEELLKGPLEEIRADMRLLKEYAERHALRIEQTNQRIDETNQRIDETNQRIDETNQRIDTLGGRLDARIDELTREQSRLAEEVALLKTDRAVTGDVLHRLERIEDKVLV